MRFTLLLCVAIAIGLCGCYITDSDIRMGEELCKKHGGYGSGRVGDFFTSTIIWCKDDYHFNVTDEAQKILDNYWQDEGAKDEPQH